MNHGKVNYACINLLSVLAENLQDILSELYVKFGCLIHAQCTCLLFA